MQCCAAITTEEVVSTLSKLDSALAQLANAKQGNESEHIQKQDEWPNDIDKFVDSSHFPIFKAILLS